MLPEDSVFSMFIGGSATSETFPVSDVLSSVVDVGTDGSDEFEFKFEFAPLPPQPANTIKIQTNSKVTDLDLFSTHKTPFKKCCRNKTLFV